jgi:hypothetical protein
VTSSFSVTSFPLKRCLLLTFSLAFSVTEEEEEESGGAAARGGGLRRWVGKVVERM